ncbi:protein-export chaperone SecB [Enterococcus gallinarum]|uniref:protein-export chaperone SecB n=1 Tax=Enterococcus TaxID=1350 RepID=UPI0029545D0E|nr:protein-export chaperone SecB [Enterococcus casseliflavus]MDV7690057.1 protein-export chaperone SecB [Enterococcus casseliflavus]
MASITFKDFYVDFLEYKENPNFANDDTKTLDVDIKPKADIVFKGDLAVILFESSFGSEENVNCPFTANISLKSFFEYEVTKNDDDIKQLQLLLSQNALAMVYPYIRSLVSDLTLRSNKFPAFILPTINVVELMEKNKSIVLHDLDKAISTDDDNEKQPNE